MAYEIWTDEAVELALQTPGVKLESAKDRAKWMAFYAEMDALVAPRSDAALLEIAQTVGGTEVPIYTDAGDLEATVYANPVRIVRH